MIFNIFFFFFLLPLKDVKNPIKGAVSVNLSEIPCDKWQCPIYNGFPVKLCLIRYELDIFAYNLKTNY